MPACRFTFKSLIPVLILLLAGCQLRQGVRVLKFAHGLNVSHPMHHAFVHLAEETARLSGGKMRIDIYPAAQLGAERECLELLQIGSIDITKTSAAVMEGFVKEYKIISLPYLFKSKQHAMQVLEGPVGQKLLQLPKAVWLRGLGFYDAGTRSFYTQKPVYKPEDLAGLKIRVQKSVLAVNLVKALGASPTPISWSEIYTALQSGVVDGAENNLPSFYNSGHYEVCKYYSLNEHTVVPDLLLISLHTWQKLSKQEQEWLTEAVQSSIVFQREGWKVAEEEALEKVQAAGVQIIKPDKEAFAQKVKHMHRDLAQDPDINALLQQIEQDE